MESSRPSRDHSYFAHPVHGPLPAILLLLTFGTGLIDAISILGLGRVFVANMTGNVVFIGFALAGAPGYSLWGSLVALAGFLVGASVGGIVISRFGAHRGRMLRNALIVQLALFLAALVISLTVAARLPVADQLVIVALGALALGIQNAVVRRLAVPDMTTTVLTMTLTGIGSDLRKKDLATAGRRLIAVLAMLIGAGIGAVLVLRLGVSAGILAVTIMLAVALIGTAFAAR
ncbi:MAG TPA: YoaK family protein, partial [Galbitalea sp.]|nr:YoaK family protein [Galbitalea sp.]